MIRRPFRRIALIALGALTLTHCAYRPVVVDRDVAKAPEQQEREMGAQGNQAVLREYAALDLPVLQAYVDEVGQRLAKQSPRPDLQWHFTVLDSPDVNAFSLPGGYVYVTRGLLAYLNSEAELAGVVGHEIGHVAARHGVPRTDAHDSAPSGGALDSVLEPETGNQPGRALVQAMAPAWQAGYGRERELEADRLGTEYLARAGYNPQAMLRAIGELENQAQYAARQTGREGGQATYHGVFDTPAGSDVRLKQAVAEANKYRVASPREGRSDYLRKLAGLFFGDSPDQGVLRNNALLHEKLGLTIQFPPGWRVQNRPDRVVATSPEGDALVELEQGPKNDDPLATLQQGIRLDAGARYDSGHLGGYPAAFAAGARQGMPVVVAAVVFNGTQYLIAGMTKDTLTYERERAALRAAINSFRAITPAERAVAQPRVLQLISARPGLTMTALARQSVLGVDGESQLRLMNDLYPNGEPRTGQLLKIVQ